MSRWILESNTWIQGDIKLILDSDDKTVDATISGSTYASSEDVIDEP